jgi:hypothetical protein
MVTLAFYKLHEGKKMLIQMNRDTLTRKKNMVYDVSDTYGRKLTKGLRSAAKEISLSEAEESAKLPPELSVARIEHIEQVVVEWVKADNYHLKGQKELVSKYIAETLVDKGKVKLHKAIGKKKNGKL